MSDLKIWTPKFTINSALCMNCPSHLISVYLFFLRPFPNKTNHFYFCISKKKTNETIEYSNSFVHTRSNISNRLLCFRSFKQKVSDFLQWERQTKVFTKNYLALGITEQLLIGFLVVCFSSASFMGSTGKFCVFYHSSLYLILNISYNLTAFSWHSNQL